MAKQKRLHHYLVTGFLLIKTEEKEDLTQLTLNSMVKSDIRHIPMRLIGKAQQALQVALHQRMHDGSETPKYEVVDVVILNMLHLGHMTDEQFNATPGAKLEERKTSTGQDPFADSSVAEILPKTSADPVRP